MQTIPWKDPWLSLEGMMEVQAGLDAALAEEISSDHVLAGRAAHAIGRRRDNDDVIYVLDGGGPEYAVVHLTWCGRQTSPDWPATVMLPDVAAVVRCIESDAALIAIG